MADGLVCPVCRCELDLRPGGARRCQTCARTYPEVAGIPDLRLRGDRYLSLAEDRAKAERLAGEAERSGLTFAEMVAAYWSMTPEVPPALAERYAANAVDGVRRADHLLATLGPPAPDESVLDVGCGTGGLAVAASRRGAKVTGIDIALRWLVIARRALAEDGVAARLVAADGALPPFLGATFDRVWSVETLEHAEDQRGLLQHCLLSCRTGGRVLVVTANRFSLAADPSVRLWGLGYLPRRWAVPYVRLRRHTRYQHMRPLSASELAALVGLRRDLVVSAGPLPAPPLDATMARRRAQAVYDRARVMPLIGWALTPVAPFLQVAGLLDGRG